MTEGFEITSVGGTERVALRALNRDYVAVTVTGANLSASSKVAFLGGGDFLNDYWADIAKSWRGWSGEKVWRSLEGDLGFTATCSITGRVTLEVTLEYGAPWKWKAQAVLTIESGQLDGLASAALAFARKLGATA